MSEFKEFMGYLRGRGGAYAVNLVELYEKFENSKIPLPVEAPLTDEVNPDEGFEISVEKVMKERDAAVKLYHEEMTLRHKLQDDLEEEKARARGWCKDNMEARAEVEKLKHELEVEKNVTVQVQARSEQHWAEAEKWKLRANDQVYETKKWEAQVARLKSERSSEEKLLALAQEINALSPTELICVMHAAAQLANAKEVKHD